MQDERQIEQTLLTVPSTYQVEVGQNVFLEGSPDGSPAIMFLGNSVTWHGPKADIGWTGRWGMAASAREKDYAHLLMARVRGAYPNACFALTQGAVWEMALERCSLEVEFAPARDFGADIIVFTLGANTQEEGLTQARFRDSMEALLRYLSKEGAKWILCSNFFQGGKNVMINGAIQEVAEKYCADYVEMSDVLIPPENRAIGLFEHQGVANHPGDAGMACIASIIWPYLDRNLIRVSKGESQ